MHHRCQWPPRPRSRPPAAVQQPRPGSLTCPPHFKMSRHIWRMLGRLKEFQISQMQRDFTWCLQTLTCLLKGCCLERGASLVTRAACLTPHVLFTGTINCFFFAFCFAFALLEASKIFTQEGAKKVACIEYDSLSKNSFKYSSKGFGGKGPWIRPGVASKGFGGKRPRK